MTRTVAPKDLGGRLERNLARTTPELPAYVRERSRMQVFLTYRAAG